MDKKKIREAIALIKIERTIHEYGTCISPSIPKEQNSKVGEYYDLAIEALEKQMAKKPEMRTAYNDFDGRLICYKGFCPSCGGVVESYRNESCHHCTQMLDWSE